LRPGRGSGGDQEGIRRGSGGIRLKGSVREKWKNERVYTDIEFNFLITSNFTSICCVYEEKIFRNM